ncbi:MAG: GNAT family N-acetyltransferase [Methylococcaceae bacterium]|nr:GNAT family N-acetyltransferase [Methylococcaceae bacterium]
MIQTPKPLSDEFQVQLIEPESYIKPKLLAEISQLRQRVWQEFHEHSAKAFNNVWLGEIDHKAYIWCIFHQQQLVGSGRMSLHSTLEQIPDSFVFKGLEDFYPPLIASFNRLVIAPEFTRRGLAKFLMQSRLQKAFELGTRAVAIEAPLWRVPALQSLGFEHLKSTYSIRDYQLNTSAMRFCFNKIDIT